jgi:phospholipase C
LAAQAPTALGNLSKINHFVVLMLENRSFDHLLGALKAQNPAVAGALDNEFSNQTDPAVPTSPPVATGPALKYAMPFDPGHEFEDVQIQLYGRVPSADRRPAPPTDAAPMNGFVYSAEQAAKLPTDAGMVMQCFHPERLPTLTALAAEFALFNYWHSSLPGPTWPNRFFVHAATSGGLSDSPTDPDILAGFTFPAGTLYRSLGVAGKDWRIYHDGLPQAAGIDSLRLEYINIFTKNFRDMKFIEEDFKKPTLPEYVFIEPKYDTGRQFVKGNSMHPLNDVRQGEKLVKRVYDALRGSKFWADSMLIVTFDEHGGFFDHVPPPPATAPGGDQRYSDPANHFNFDRLGVRVPTIVASPYTQKNTVVGNKPQDCYDHTSILATVQKRFLLPSLTFRDGAAQTMESVLNQDSPRLSPSEAPLTLPMPITDILMTKFLEAFAGSPADPAAPMTVSQRVQLTLAHACDLQTLDPPSQIAARHRYLGIRAQQDAADYVEEVEDRIRDRRRSSESAP